MPKSDISVVENIAKKNRSRFPIAVLNDCISFFLGFVAAN